ncbi:uncharacterized protein LOC115446035 [Manduca sexta]|uniref:Cilia- and flagella-associated protein 69 ARM repeats domain-containing protein n=1 Tax=Manduca sexta TaxID=7130 RepID=A0A921ZC80_MANSE|nr:uncharacterized protein LOC115446035 [Manduca sexta]KAG6454112.1 hypothetical protein O3G_MSEX008497 [Manduca sexta]
MDKKRSALNTFSSGSKKDNEVSRKAKGEGDVSTKSSHTQFLRQPRHETKYERITRNQYFGESESISGSSNTFGCVHGAGGKKYSEKGLLKRNIMKELDPIPSDPKWNDGCPPAFDWGMAKKLQFLVMDPTVDRQMGRLEAHLRDFASITRYGYRIDILDCVVTIIDYLIETLNKAPNLRQYLEMLLVNLGKPILLTAASDVIKYVDVIRDYMGFLGYLLMRLEDDYFFDLVSKGILWQLAAPDDFRKQGAVPSRYILTAAAPVIHQTTVRMLAVSTSHRYPTFLNIALILAWNSMENCIDMVKENIFDNIFYRFNPYFPERKLPMYDINPADLDDFNVKLGDSSVNMSTTLSLLLVLVNTTKQYLDENPKQRVVLPCPDDYSQRCYIWAYRYECRAREHHHERISLTVIAHVLLNCFRDRLMTFSSLLMPDIFSLAVLTELPPRNDWIRTVNFATAQSDVQFKKTLIYLSVDFLKVFPYNRFMVETRYWLLGLMYLLDPGLCHLRKRWSQALFGEIRKTALQALVCVLPFIPVKLAKEYGLIRRIMWYIEWYSESPYELPTLYWCVRLLQVATYQRRKDPKARQATLKDLFDSHGIIILIKLCYTLLEQKLPPVEKSQAVIAVCLRLLTSAVEPNRRVECCVYPNITWPSSVNSLAMRMLDVVLYSLDKHFIVSNRLLISLLNFIWQGIVWKPDYREIFVANNGIYKLLDIITMAKPPVQCIALALICDVARAGDALGQLVSWRANLGAANVHPNIVSRGSTIASLLAAVFRDDCQRTGVTLNEYGYIENLDCPIMSSEVRKKMNELHCRGGFSQRTPVCLPASDLAGSRMSKAFALLHLLSEDLEYKVSLADEAYNLYKNIRLTPEDESALVLCSHYLTLKLVEVWAETKVQNVGLLPQDNEVLEEFLHIGKGWAKDIRLQQEDIIENDRKKEYEEECSLYAFLGRVRLNIALDALREVRCMARSADRARMTHALLHDAVRAHHRRSVFSKKLSGQVLRTYGPSLDDQNITGQYVKVTSIHVKGKPRPIDNISSGNRSEN